MSSWKVSIRSTMFLTVRIWAAASARLRGGQRQRGDLLGGVAVAQEAGGGVRGDPGEQRRDLREVVVDGRRRHRRGRAVASDVAGGGQVVAPGAHLARGDGREPVVPEAVGDPGGEALQMPGDLGGDLGRADPAHGQFEVALRPDWEAVVGRIEVFGKPDHLS
ncbi:hypothetical protein ACWDR1_02245 [Streptosporangium sandarakinum]